MFKLATSAATRNSGFMLRNARTLPRTSCMMFSTETKEDVGGFHKIACIGTGKMAQAVLRPMINTGLQPPEKVSVFDVSMNTMEQVQTDLGVQISENIGDCMDGADLVICAVKPQNLTPAFWNECLKANLRDDCIFLSVIAGKTVDTFRAGGFEKIVRSMPNTPAAIGQGMTVWACTENLSTVERKKIKNILSSFGKSMYVDDEKFIDLATSISGSGPAYIFLLMEAMMDCGVHMGFPRDQAATLVYHTMLGSTLYAMETGEHPAILRNMVTSPSGTTASAIYELEAGRFRTVIKDAMWACYRRSLEMGDHDSNVGPGRYSMPEPRIVLRTDSDNDSDNEDDDDQRNRSL